VSGKTGLTGTIIQYKRKSRGRLLKTYEKKCLMGHLQFFILSLLSYHAGIQNNSKAKPPAMPGRIAKAML
jgi:hypothetical protein